MYVARDKTCVTFFLLYLNINEIAYVRKRLVDDLNEKSNSDAGLKKTYV